MKIRDTEYGGMLAERTTLARKRDAGSLVGEKKREGEFERACGSREEKVVMREGKVTVSNHLLGD